MSQSCNGSCYSAQLKVHTEGLLLTRFIPLDGDLDSVLGLSLGAHYLRMLDLFPNIKCDPGQLNKHLIPALAIVHDDYLLVGGTTINDEKEAKTKLKDRFSMLFPGNFRYDFLISRISMPEDGIVKCACVLDQLLFFEMNNLSLESYDGLIGKWMSGMREIHSSPQRINGLIGSLPETFNEEAIKSSLLANKWREQVESWKIGNLPKLVAEKVNVLYSPTAGQEF